MEAVSETINEVDDKIKEIPGVLNFERDDAINFYCVTFQIPLRAKILKLLSRSTPEGFELDYNELIKKLETAGLDTDDMFLINNRTGEIMYVVKSNGKNIFVRVSRDFYESRKKKGLEFKDGTYPLKPKHHQPSLENMLTAHSASYMITFIGRKSPEEKRDLFGISPKLKDFWHNRHTYLQGLF